MLEWPGPAAAVLFVLMDSAIVAVPTSHRCYIRMHVLCMPVFGILLAVYGRLNNFRFIVPMGNV